MQTSARSTAASRLARACFKTLDPRRLLSAGDLDASFSNDGTATFNFPGITNEFVNATLVQPDGKTLVAGRATVGSETDFFVARLAPTGVLDTSFSTDGVATIDFGGNDEANDIALDADGRIVVVGTTGVGAAGTNARQFAVARLTDFGGLNTGQFSIDGKTTIDFGINAEAQAVAIDGDLIYVGGFKDLGASGQFALVRLTELGAQDTTYSTDGEVFFGFGSGGDDRCYDIAIDSAHRVVMVGYDRSTGTTTGRNFAYARVGTNALLDPAFSGDGLAVTDFSLGDDEARSIVIDAQGRYVVGGYASGGSSNDDFAAIRITNTGSLDSSFNGDGRFRHSLTVDNSPEIVEQVLLHPDGDITLVGTTTAGNNDAVIVRLRPTDGQFSTTFGDGGTGIVRLDLGTLEFGFTGALDPNDLRTVIAGSNGAGSVAFARVHDLIDQNFNSPGTSGYEDLIQLPDGKLLARSGASVSRLNADGSVDPSFTPINANMFGKAMKVDSLGRIIVAGQFNNGSVTAGIVRRYLANGVLDTTFSGDGAMTFLFTSSNPAIINAIAIDSANRIVVAGYDAAGIVTVDDVALARINTNGTLDTTFDGDGIAIFTLSTSFDTAEDVLIQSDGKIVVVGSERESLFVMRLNTNGSRDNSFAGNGLRTFDFGGISAAVGRSVVLDSTDRIVVAGSVFDGIVEGTSRSFLSRLTTSGSFDVNFGSGGIVEFLVPGSDEVATAVQIDSAGSIFTLGELQFGTDDLQLVVRKFSAAGDVQTSFASDGLWIAPLPRVSLGIAASDHIGFIANGAIHLAGATQLMRLNVAPSVVDFKFEFETFPQRLVVKFNDDIGDSLVNDTAFNIRNITTNTTLNTSAYDIASYDPLTNTAIANFTSILPDGGYTVTFSNAQIENRQNMQLAGDRTHDFFFMAGDANRDRRVNFDDLLILAASYNTSGRTFSQGDFNYDSIVNFDDLLVLASRYNQSLLTAGSPAPLVLPGDDEDDRSPPLPDVL